MTSKLPPRALLYGKTNEKNYDRLNSTTASLTAGNEFVGEWQVNEHVDVLVSYKISTNAYITFEYSDDGGVNITREVDSVSGGDSGNIIRKKYYKYFRICIANLSSSSTNSLDIYTYYGDFNKSPDNQVVLAGNGSGSEDDPLVQRVENHPLEDYIYDLIKEQKKTNLYLSLMTDTIIENTEVE